MDPANLLLLVLFGGVLFLMFNRTRRQQREATNLRSGVGPGTKIVTTAGLYATVVEIDGQTVTLETAPGQHSRWDRRAVARVLPDDGPGDVDAVDTDAVDADGDAVDADVTPSTDPEHDPEQATPAEGTAGRTSPPSEPGQPDRA